MVQFAAWAYGYTTTLVPQSLNQRKPTRPNSGSQGLDITRDVLLTLVPQSLNQRKPARPNSGSLRLDITRDVRKEKV